MHSLQRDCNGVLQGMERRGYNHRVGKKKGAFSNEGARNRQSGQVYQTFSNLMRTWSASTAWPFSTCTLLMTPSMGEPTPLSIFMDSRMTRF